MNAKLNRGTCAPALRGKIRKAEGGRGEARERKGHHRQLRIAELVDRYPEYAFRRRNYREPSYAVAREILLFMSRNRVVPKEAGTM